MGPYNMQQDPPIRYILTTSSMCKKMSLKSIFPKICDMQQNPRHSIIQTTFSPSSENDVSEIDIPWGMYDVQQNDSISFKSKRQNHSPRHFQNILLYRDVSRSARIDGSAAICNKKYSLEWKGEVEDMSEIYVFAGNVT